MIQKTIRDYQSTVYECPTCGRDDFSSEKGVKIHHKLAHGESIAGVLKICPICGVEYRTKPHNADRLKTCGDAGCSSQYRSENYSGENHGSWNGGKATVACSYCGREKQVKQYQLERSDRFFCDQDCTIQWKQDTDLSGEQSGAWKGGLVTVECATCGREKDVKPYRTKNHDRHFCTQACKAEWQQTHLSGQGNPRWNGGFSVYARVSATISDRSWAAISNGVRGRDGVCKMCGDSAEDIGHKLDVHHIVPLRAGGTHDKQLLTSLCRSCHMTVEAYTRAIPEVEPVLTE